MKIITKDNFCRDLFTEKVIAENVNELIGKELVKEWNNRHWNDHSDYYLALVEDDYELYDGYADLM
ncbi:hypothetical protein [Niallia taxi]|uniref:hypothetical protein n=1 Tax=Niallia taxi TaxID=2499688 RepID=UPI00300BF74A